MALIIKGEMPTCCWDCDRDWETNCPLSASNEVYEEWKDVENEVRHPDCPIIGEIPDKHGDLIDRDKASTQIIAEICQFCASAENGNCDGCLVQKCLEAIGRVPTIVEATE